MLYRYYCIHVKVTIIAVHFVSLWHFRLKSEAFFCVLNYHCRFKLELYSLQSTVCQGSIARGIAWVDDKHLVQKIGKRIVSVYDNTSV